MSREQLQQSITKLRAEIDALAPNEAHHRERLGRLVTDIEAQLGDAVDDNSASVLASLNDQISEFEVEHPRITAILNDVMVTLSNLGI